MNIRNSFNANKNAIEKYIRGLYPTLDIHKQNHELSISGAPSIGVACSQEAFVDCIPPQGRKGIVVTKKIPSRILGYLDRVSAIVTRKEDQSSHTSIVCRAQGVPIVNLEKQEYEKLMEIVGQINKGESLAIDSFSGQILVGNIDIDESYVRSARERALSILKQATTLKVHANSDTAEDLKSSVSQGFSHAWPRSETLLYNEDTFPYFIAFLLEPDNAVATQKFIEGHTNAVRALFNEAQGTRVAFRLLDPPSHEFLPSLSDKPEIKRVSQILGKTEAETEQLIENQRESNPMIGHRGARLLITNKGLLRAQAVSMLSAWKEADPVSRPPAVEMLVPFVMFPAEMMAIKRFVQDVCNETSDFSDIPIKYGCMIEIPSILDYADQIAPEVDFVSFGTNDLVAVTHGIARGDAYDRYLKEYIDGGFIEEDPFFVLPNNIVGKIQKFCLQLKEINPDVEADICGEQALSTDLTSLISSGAINSVSIGTENLPILLCSLAKSLIIDINKFSENLTPAPKESPLNRKRSI